MDLGIDNRLALVMGGTGGLGLAVATELASEGARIALCGRDEKRTAAAAGALRAKGATVIAQHWDLRNLEAGHRAIDAIEAVEGPIDVLFANTGGPAPGRAVDISRDALADAFAAMVAPVVELGGRLAQSMAGRGWGRIVAALSSGVESPIPNLAISNTVRPALRAWAKNLSTELASSGVTVNCVVPGRISTGRVAALDAAKAERDHLSVAEVAAASASSIPAGRYGDPTEFAAVVAFLCGQPASYVTGTTVRIDGGMIAGV